MRTRAQELPVEQAVSAGGVVYRFGVDGLEVLLCGRIADGLWALPKGTPEGNETLEETAEREVREETGLGAKIVEELGTIQYQFVRPAQGMRFDKTVHHFLMRPDGSGSVERHDREYDIVEWFPIQDAMRSVTHRNEGVILRRAIETVGALELTS
jgi:8-oxo-dGTP pyrophosphatase MutT (NUDIX family)